jgi:hypothetical protein
MGKHLSGTGKVTDLQRTEGYILEILRFADAFQSQYHPNRHQTLLVYYQGTEQDVV